MDIEEVKEIIDRAGFSEEAKKVMDEIFEKAIKRGGLELEEKQKLLEIVDFETERANLEADVLEEIALALEGFATDVRESTEIALGEAERTKEEFKAGLSELGKELE